MFDLIRWVPKESLERESGVTTEMKWTKKILGSLQTEEQGLNNRK